MPLRPKTKAALRMGAFSLAAYAPGAARFGASQRLVGSGQLVPQALSLAAVERERANASGAK